MNDLLLSGQFLKDESLKSLVICHLPFEEVRQYVTSTFSLEGQGVTFSDGIAKLDLGEVKDYQSARDAGFFCRSKTKPDVTFVFAAGPAPLFHAFCRKIPWRFKTRAAHFYWWDLNPESPDFSLVFEYTDYSNGEIQRFVRAAREDSGKMEFFTKGAPLAFEDQQAYAKRRISARLTKSMLFQYALLLGCDIERELQSEHQDAMSFYQFKRDQIDPAKDKRARARMLAQRTQ